MFAVRRAVASTFARRCYSHAVKANTGGKKYDLFGYEVSAETAPYIEQIKKTEFYDEAGEVIVEMNLANCPPDLATYNALLERILNCKSKRREPVSGENKFCAMMDIMEEMDHRYNIKPNAESWTYLLKELVLCGDFRLGWICIAGMKSMKIEPPADLVSGNEANFEKARANGSDFPPALRRPPPESFDTKAWGI
jgi:hypothetical protein